MSLIVLKELKALRGGSAFYKTNSLAHDRIAMRTLGRGKTIMDTSIRYE